MEEELTCEVEVPGEEQAAMAVKLSDNVRELIRTELKLALTDPNFVGVFTYAPTSDAIMSAISYHANFIARVKQIIKEAIL